MSKQPPPARMAYWLIPAEPFLSECQRVISTLAERFDGPKFIPHVTIYVGPYDRADPLDEILTALTETAAPQLSTRDFGSVVFTDEFTKSCFVQFDSSPLLSKMTDLIRAAVRNPISYALSPHMSLFYGVLSEESRRVVRTEVLFPREVLFTRVMTIANPSKVTSRKEVESWKEVSRTSLQPR